MVFKPIRNEVCLCKKMRLRKNVRLTTTWSFMDT